MKTKSFIISVLALTVALVFTGCQSLNNLPAGKQTAAIELAVGVTGDIASIIVAKNPDIGETLAVISAGLETVLADGTLPPDRVADFIRRIEARHNLTLEEKVLLARGITRVHQLFLVFTGGDIDTTNPRAREFLTRVRDAINQSLALADALRVTEG